MVIEYFYGTLTATSACFAAFALIKHTIISIALAQIQTAKETTVKPRLIEQPTITHAQKNQLGYPYQM